MNLVGKGILFEFSKTHADVTLQISSWIIEIEEAEWNIPSDIKTRYVSASFLSDNRVIFNLKGNKYRIDTKISYQNKIVFVKRIGTHREYNRWKF
jgi:mRNA interferase HigB